MNIFDRDAGREWDSATRLGSPAPTAEARMQRMVAMAAMNPAGFRTPKKKVRVFADGTTRGDRKRAARERANEKEKQRQVAAAEELARRKRGMI